MKKKKILHISKIPSIKSDTLTCCCCTAADVVILVVKFYSHTFAVSGRHPAAAAPTQ